MLSGSGRSCAAERGSSRCRDRRSPWAATALSTIVRNQARKAVGSLNRGSARRTDTSASCRGVLRAVIAGGELPRSRVGELGRALEQGLLRRLVSSLRRPHERRQPIAGHRSLLPTECRQEGRSSSLASGNEAGAASSSMIVHLLSRERCWGIECELFLPQQAISDLGISIGSYHHGHPLPAPFPQGPEFRPLLTAGATVSGIDQSTAEDTARPISLPQQRTLGKRYWPPCRFSLRRLVARMRR